MVDRGNQETANEGKLGHYCPRCGRLFRLERKKAAYSVQTGEPLYDYSLKCPGFWCRHVISTLSDNEIAALGLMDPPFGNTVTRFLEQGWVHRRRKGDPYADLYRPDRSYPNYSRGGDYSEGAESAARRELRRRDQGWKDFNDTLGGAPAFIRSFFE